MLRFSHSGFEGEWSLVELTKLLVQMLYLFSLLVRDVQPSKCYEKLSQLINFVPAPVCRGRQSSCLHCYPIKTDERVCKYYILSYSCTSMKGFSLSYFVFRDGCSFIKNGAKTCTSSSSSFSFPLLTWEGH